MKIYYKFLKAVLLHKWYVLLAGLKIDVPIWQLIIHDWQKLTPIEFSRYARNYHGDYTKSPNDRKKVSVKYTYAWLHHENSAKHHWGHWIPRTGNYAGEPLEMPMRYVKEMVADCMGASKLYTGCWNMSEWLNENCPSWQLHPKTETKLHTILVSAGYVETDNCQWSYMLSVNKRGFR